MAVQNPFKVVNGRTFVDDTLIVKKPRPEDNCRVIWFADGKLHHAYTKWQNLPTIHNEIWSWKNWEPDEIWAFHMGLCGWCLSKRDYKGNSLLTAMLKKEDGTTNVPKDIELYNALLGD